MKPILSLAHLTVLHLTPPEMVRCAARIGYDQVGFRMVAVTETTPGYPLMDDPAMLRETKAALNDTGVGVHDIEFFRIVPDFDVAPLERAIASGAELGARQLMSAPYDPDLNRMADNFAVLCEMCGKYGLSAVLEFFPWTSVPSLVEAKQVIEKSGASNGGILVDTLHFTRSGSDLALLDQIKDSQLPFLHLCDAGAHIPENNDQLIAEARGARLPPGEGSLKLAEIIAHMPAGIPVSLEVPMDDLTQAMGPEAVAKRCYDGAMAVFAHAELGKERPAQP